MDGIPLCEPKTTLVRVSGGLLRNRRVSSPDPSSMTISSQSSKVCAYTEARAARAISSRLKVGSTTLTIGGAISRHRRRADTWHRTLVPYDPRVRKPHVGAPSPPGACADLHPREPIRARPRAPPGL